MFAQFLQGPPNPAVAAGLQHGIDLNHQAMALSRQGDHAGAAELHRRALQHKLNHHGTGNITTAVSFNALGEELMHLDRLDEAEENIKQALEIAIKLHSTSDQGFYRENLAMVYEMKGDLDKARTTRHENAPDKFVCANYAVRPPYFAVNCIF